MSKEVAATPNISMVGTECGDDMMMFLQVVSDECCEEQRSVLLTHLSRIYARRKIPQRSTLEGIRTIYQKVMTAF